MFKVNLIIFLIGISPFLEALTSNNFCTKHGPTKEIKYCCPGYVGDGENCSPICFNGCENGVCIEPFVCECNEGFTKHQGPHSPCVPIPTTIVINTPQRSCAERCSNGTCVNDVCTCAPGWLLQQHDSRDICVPPCNGGCVNGYCSAANKCVCSKGYEPLPLNQFECVRPSGSGALWNQSAQFVTILTSLLLLIRYYCAFWKNINA
uniref:Teneurin-4 n=1 Tax=Zeugodacus cucurbitae TaxID=28588 RepID=A0A0A1WP00_ZEUCU